MQNEFSYRMRVYIEDTDAGGIVYYVNYLKFMERARTELLRERGLPKPAILDDEKLLVVAQVKVDYKRSAKLDDELKVTASITKVARSYMVFKQEIWCGDICLTEGEVKVACVNKDTLRPCPFPERVARLLN